MATLPRTHSSKYGNTSISSPFNTSPRKLQEMTLHVSPPEGHDLTTTSSISMKQYEDQLKAVQKENFQLRLRIYFLEEKLGNGAPPAVQGLLEHNVRLQVEVEELKRQLSDKQELLAAAAEAIDVLEQQVDTYSIYNTDKKPKKQHSEKVGSISNDSIENGMNLQQQENEFKAQENDQETVEETGGESDTAMKNMSSAVNNEDLDKLERLRRENRKALQMIKGCMKKIQQQNKEIKKLKLDKELVYAQVSDSQLEKYQEILKCKDEHIKELENKIKNLQFNIESGHQSEDTGNLQQLLTRRLQGLAYFLDKLLSHKCVLGEDKKKLAESILEQSLTLPVGLQLDESVAPEELTMDEIDMSQSFRIEDLTMMFGHHMSCGEISKRRSSQRALKHFPRADDLSESECWSEPDRNVSLARVGLRNTEIRASGSIDEVNRFRSRRSRVSHGSRSDEKVTNESVIMAEINEVMLQNEDLKSENTDLKNKLDTALNQINDLTSETEALKAAIIAERSNTTQAKNEVETMKLNISSMELRMKEIEQRLNETIQDKEKMRTERQELESMFLETERSLRRAADEATVQASQAALERARAQHEKMRIEKELDDTREKLTSIMEAKGRLEIEVAQHVAANVENKVAIIYEGVPSEEERPTSPDQGIDSDRLSSLEQNDRLALSPRSLYEENMTLKQKLARTKATLAETLQRLNEANMRKSVQRAICREIHKTHGVLRKARDQLENKKDS